MATTMMNGTPSAAAPGAFARGAQLGGPTPSPLPVMPGAAAAPAPGGGLAGGAGTLGAVPPQLAQLLARQMAQRQPGGAGTPQQQAQAPMGGLGALLGHLQGPAGAAAGATTVPGTTAQSPFTTPTNAPNAAMTALKSGGPVMPPPAGMPGAAPPPAATGGIGAAGAGQLGQMNPQMMQQLIARLKMGGGGAGAPAAGAAPQPAMPMPQRTAMPMMRAAAQ